MQIGTDIENWFSPAFIKNLDWLQGIFDHIHAATSYNGDPSTLSPAKQALRHSLGLDRYDQKDGKGGPSSSPPAPTPTNSPHGRAGLSRRLGQYSDSVSWAGEGSGYFKADQKDRVTALMDRLITKHGWTPEAAAIAAGNAVQESNVQANGHAGDGGISQGMFQWNHERLAALQTYGGANWRDPGVQTDFMAKEAEGKIPGWKGVTDLNRAGEISYAYEGFGNKGEMNPGSSRMRSIAAALALYRARKAGGQGSGAYKDFGAWNKEGQTFGHTVTGATDKGAFVDGQRFPWWAHLPGSPMHSGTLGNAGAGGASAGDVSKDAAQGDSWLKRMWNGTGSALSIPGPQSSLSTLHAFHPVTTSSTSNQMHINGGINVTVPRGADGHSIASAIERSLNNYAFAMAGNSGQV